MFADLEEINRKPEVFGSYTAQSLWADAYRAKQMLAFHLNETVDLSSRNVAFINRSSSWIVERFQLEPGRSVCDFGCGPGLYTSRFAQSGAHVTGLDFSENSIRYARAQAANANQRINYIHANYLAFDPNERFDLITMIMCDFCALSPAQRKAVLRRFHKCLKEDGAILLDAYSMVAYAAREETSFYEKNQLNHFWCEQDYYCFVNTFKYEQESVALDKYSIFHEDGQKETVYNWLQYFSADSLTKELLEAGFSAPQLFRDVAGSPFSEQHTEFAIVAGRR
ncbi:MAG: class I SAM-dependent methyltransferase [Pseudomonadota bacterium]